MSDKSSVDDPRNLVDELKGQTEADVIAKLDDRGVALEIAIENLERDFNMGSIVRTANAFGVRHVHIIGRRSWNKRGAMATDRYLHVHYHPSVAEFVAATKDVQLIAVDNVSGAHDITQTKLPVSSVLVFGSEANGLSDELLNAADETVMIPQRGSTRSLNVGAAAAIAIYEWLRQNV